jgi:hypothetical protein
MKGNRMRVLNRFRPVLALAVLAAAATVVAAADPAATKTAPVYGMSDRLFLSFAQDAAIAPSQWWEGQLEYQNGSSGMPVDALIVRGVFAFQPVHNLEVGGSFGLGNSNTPPGYNDGTGATDLNVYAKWMFLNAADNLDFTAGALLTLPTGDDSAGLGFNSFGFQGFGAMRYRMDGAIIGGNIGVRYNGDGEFLGSDINGKTSFELSVCALFPLANSVTITAEAQIETSRFEGVDSTANLVGGVDWKAFKRGVFRAALAAGLTDSTPNYRILAGYAYTF